MKLTKSFTTVTPLSKALALALFVILPIAAFFMGMQIQKQMDDLQLFTQNYKSSIKESTPGATPSLQKRVASPSPSIPNIIGPGPRQTEKAMPAP